MNPYTAPSAVAITAAIESDRFHWCTRKHFLSFNATFVSCLVVFYCVFAGPTATLTSLLSEPVSWLIQVGLGILAWTVHSVILHFAAPLRSRGPVVNGVIGASAFVALVLVSQIVQDYAPNSLSVPWSWTPESIRLTIYTGGSIAGVALLAVFPTRSSRNGQPIKI